MSRKTIYRCEECGLKFRNDENLLIHMMDFHELDDTDNLEWLAVDDA